MIGQTVGHYRIESKLGEGGMGVVYRARDTHLDRLVAIKVLSRTAVADPERTRRFVQEAKAASALNHPNIVHVYDIDSSASGDFIAMEHLDGETLDRHIGPKGLRLHDALRYAVQIADALSAAHAAGIVHRDVKPSNVIVTNTAHGDSNLVKLLDFGVAKLTEWNKDDPDAVTGTANPQTEAGAIVGTVAYMSPEQAEGKRVDGRSDIFSFGSVLYEMIAGRRAFERGSPISTLSAILHEEPSPLVGLVDGVRRELAHVIARCLRKDPRRRFQVIADVKIALEDLVAESDIPQPETDGTRAAPRRTVWVLLGSSVIAAGLVVGAVLLRPTALDTGAYRFVPLAVEPADETSPSWSPDGKSIVYVADVGGRRQLFTRSLDAAVSTQITRFSTDCLTPFWSPDGARIYFISQGPYNGQQLWSVGATGGEPQLVMKDAPVFAVSPDGRTLAFLRGPGGNRSLWLTALSKLDPQQYRTPPFPETFGLSTSHGFSRDGTKIGVLVRRQEGTSYTSELWIVPYPTGPPRPVLERIPEAADSQISWVPDNRHIVWNSAFPDRLGSHLYVADTERSTIRQITFGTANELSPSVSPDGDRIAFAAGSDDFDLFSVPLDGSTVQTLLASARSETRPTWSPTGSQLAYVTNARGTSEIWVRSLEGGWARPLVKQDAEGPATWQSLGRPSFSPDGQRIVYEAIGAKHAIMVSSVADGRGVLLDPESPDQHSPDWSPDGNWIAYQRLQGGHWELVKTSLSGGQPVHLAEAAPGGGDHTAWSPTGEWIAHIRAGLLRLTSADGQTQKTLNGLSPAAFGFSRDGSWLYAVRHALDGRWSLVVFDVRSGQEGSVADLNLPPRATVTGFGLHPNGKSFATAIGIARHDIWLLEGFGQRSRWFSGF